MSKSKCDSFRFVILCLTLNHTSAEEFYLSSSSKWGFDCFQCLTWLTRHTVISNLEEYNDIAVRNTNLNKWGSKCTQNHLYELCPINLCESCLPLLLSGNSVLKINNAEILFLLQLILPCFGVFS